MEITKKLKERFCKDMNIPIKLFDEPYFTSRLELYDKIYNTKEKYKLFLETLSNFDSEQHYFSTYNKLKDDIINYLKENEAMQRFIDSDIKEYDIVNIGFPTKDIFKSTFDGKILLSIDMKKANFTALKYYDKNIVGCKDTYEEFIGMFTKYDYFKRSKYIRQVVFGNCNPKRQIRLEKKLMDSVLTDLLTFTNPNDIVFFSTDEIVVDISSKSNLDRKLYKDVVGTLLNRKEKEEGLLLEHEVFELKKIPNTDAYVKKFLYDEGIEFKCLDSLLAPFVLRAYAREEVTEEDKVFVYENKMAKLLEVPEIEIV